MAEKYTFFLTNYPYLSKFFPPRRKNLKNKSEKIKILKDNESEDIMDKNNKKKSKHASVRYPKLNSQSGISRNSDDLMVAINKKNSKLNVKEKSSEINNDNNTFEEQGKQIKKYFKDYLSTSPDDMEFDDAIKKDKRSFCEYLCDCLKENQSIAYTFIASDPINTRMIKFVLFCLNLDLYFVVNGLFFSESFISELYHTDEEDENFFSFIPRTIDKVIYTTLVSVVIGYMTDFFFLDENKVKGIFKREKHNKVILKRSIALLIKEIQNRYIAFIIMSLVIIIASLYYILCFNYVYPKTQIEWIKSSILIIIIMQILSIIKCLFETIFRFLSFKFESDNLYKISKVFDSNS